ncbi:MAG: hypothetical protein JNM18_14670 [Planctomycetaceae bacterium]|nr:hypothetical protein [Planctomycetaceae bacterium]
MSRYVFVMHVAATLFMVGLIWFVQIVHYPLLSNVGQAEFPGYETRHVALTTWVVALPMLTEGATALLLFKYRPPFVPKTYLYCGALLLAIVWLSTAWLQVPCHDALQAAFTTEVHAQLVASNWLRTVAWSLRGLLVLAMIMPADTPPAPHARSRPSRRA